MSNCNPKIACLPNGPYYLLHGQTPAAVPNLCREGGDACATVRGVALCRCGSSHWRIGFRDAAP